MSRRRVMVGVLSVLVVALSSVHGAGRAREDVTLDRRLPASAGAAMDALEARFDSAAAMDLVQFMDRYWRNAANEGFNASIDRIQARLAVSGFAPRADAAPGQPSVWVEAFGKANGWDHSIGTLTLLGDGADPDEVVLSRERHRVALCINSFSTPPGGVTAPVLDVGAGVADADYDRVDVKGAVVLGDAGAGRLWQQAVVRRGAIGVVSTALEGYVRPGPPSTDGLPRDQWDVLQWGSIPYDDARRGFGFKASPRAAARLRVRLARGRARVRVEVTSSFTPGPVKTLVAEIPGRLAPHERIVVVAHIQEPGANDNASGCGTQVEMARAMAAAVKDGTMPAPGRTITFLWVDEMRGSRQWLQDHSADAKGVRYMFSLDMTGEDTAKTGGTFLIEKLPDPTAVLPRPSDPFSEWGGRPMKADALSGSLLNDVFLAVCVRRSRTTGWVVRTNPHEGGSDHSVFLAAGIPAVLAWHFPDRFYHTSLDRPEMTSPATMAHVAVSVGATVSLLATASEADAQAVVGLLEAAAQARLDLESRQGADLVARAADRAAAEMVETQVRTAWLKWYGEALDAVVALPVGGSTPALGTRIEAAKGKLR